MESSKDFLYRGKGERTPIKCVRNGAHFKEAVQPEWKDNLCIKQIKTLKAIESFKEAFKKVKRKEDHVLMKARLTMHTTFRRFKSG